MKNLNQDILNIKQGLEPITIIGIKWNGTTEIFYGDKDVPLNSYIFPRIVNLAELQNQITVDGTSSASNITVKLDDSVDGSIRVLLNEVDVYLAPVSVYQWFNGYPLDLKARIYEGSIVGPITWSEYERSVEIQCTTRFANIQVGFSYDETNVQILHQSLIGKVWPLPFGTPINYPALQLQEIPSGITTIPFGVPDPSIYWQLAKIDFQIQQQNAPYLKLINSLKGASARTGSKNQDQYNSYYIPLITKEMVKNAKSLTDQIIVLQKQLDDQKKYALHENSIIGGFKFPQGKPLICKIGEQLYTCTFLGEGQNITNPNQACPVHIVPFFPSGYPDTSGNGDPASPDYSYHFGNTFSTFGGIDVPTPPGLAPYPQGYPVVKQGFTWVSPGSNITLVDDFDFSFLVSYLPGTVINVMAYKSYNGERKLTQIPPRYYTIETQGTITFVKMKRPLSIISYLINERNTEAEAYTNQLASDFNGYVNSHVLPSTDWEDQIYVTFESSIGPNVASIIAWLVTNYTPYALDNTSFNEVGSFVANYPANFVVMDRPLVDQLMQNIAYQSRCSLILKDGTYFLTYLPKQPFAVADFTFDNIDEQSLKVSTTPIEDLITRYTASWKPEYSPDYSQPNKIILKNNHQKYGYIDEERDFFIYNQWYLVQKSALFWLLRKSNVFKIVTFTAFLDNLNVEVQDGVIIDFPNTLSDEAFYAIVTGTTYNSNENTIQFTCWTPIKTGQQVPYLFAWPSTLAETDYFFPVQTTSSGGSLGFAPITVGPLPQYNSIPTQQIDYSSWPDLTADYNDYVARATAFGGSLSADSQQQYNLDHQNQTQNQGSNTPTNQPRYSIGDSVDPTNNANQKNTHIPHKTNESTQPANPQLSPSLQVPLLDTPVAPAGSGGDASSYPAQIISGSGHTFECKIYTLGLDKDPITATVNEVHGDETLLIDPTVWIWVANAGSAYYMVQPSWSH